jgi:hypothetical protein
MGELLVNDYSRKGFVDGRSLRLPTITVRPGKPNAAASSFASGIIREPLNNVESVVPVSPDTRMWVLSPRSVIDSLIAGHDVDATTASGELDVQRRATADLRLAPTRSRRFAPRAVELSGQLAARGLGRPRLRHAIDACAVGDFAHAALRGSTEHERGEPGPGNRKPAQIGRQQTGRQGVQQNIDEMIAGRRVTPKFVLQPERRMKKWIILFSRAKLEPDPSHPIHIQTVHGVGYKFLAEGHS